MKRLIIIMAMMSLALQGMAQTESPDASFYNTLQPISNSPPAHIIAYAEYYYRMPWPPYIPDRVYTNNLDFYVPLPGTPKDVRILKKEENGSLKAVIEITNFTNDATGYFLPPSYYLQPWLTLTINQVHSLMAGDWYLEVDYDGSNYLGNLAPSFSFVPGPTAVMDFPPVPGNFSYTGYTVISTNNRTAEVILDGAHCTDPYYLPVRFHWTGTTGWHYDPSAKFAFKDNGVTAKEVLGIGLYTVELQVNDKHVDGQPFYFYVTVVTPGEALDSYISVYLQGSGIVKGEMRALTDILTTSEIYFNRGEMAKGCAELEVYKSAMNAFHFDKTETSWLLPPIQDILNAFSGVKDSQLPQQVVPID